MNLLFIFVVIFTVGTFIISNGYAENNNQTYNGTEDSSDFNMLTDIPNEQIEKIPLKSKQFYHILRAVTSDGLSITGSKSYIESGEFDIFVQSEKDSVLDLQIPLDLITVRTKCKGFVIQEDVFIVVDGKEVQKESKTKIQDDFMFLEIPVAKNSTTIEIIITTDQYDWQFPNGCPITYFKSALSYSPLKQIKHGIENSEIVCRDGLDLVFKSTDNSPACVKPETKTILEKRGWIELPAPYSQYPDHN